MVNLNPKMNPKRSGKGAGSQGTETRSATVAVLHMGTRTA